MNLFIAGSIGILLSTILFLFVFAAYTAYKTHKES